MSHGMEVECAVLGDARGLEVSVPGEIVIEAEWYDYEAKYEPGGMELVVPARIPEEARERVAQLAVEAFSRSGCSGMARCDFFVEEPEGEPPRAAERAEHHPGLHRHERVREALRGERRARTPRCWTGCSRWRWTATGAKPNSAS